MTTSILDDENAHVKELNRLFLSCAKNGDSHLDASGLQDLCVKLNLSTFTNIILERILSDCTVVNFKVFKERFVQLLPDIISITTAAEDLENNVEKNLSGLGIEPHGFITRYEARILCQITPELDRLRLVEIDELFDQADTNHIGRITMAQFLAQYQIQKRLGDEVNFIAQNFVPIVNLFEALDPSKTGTVRCQELLEHWRMCGISSEQGLHVLKHTGQAPEGVVNAVALSASLERQLGDLATAPTASIVIRVALLSLHAFIDHLRCSLKEAELRAEHFYKQLQQANQRHAVLIEELEQSQVSIEQAYEQRFRDSDERYRLKINQMEERFSQEKKDLVFELEKAEEEIVRLQKNESSCRTRLQLVERQFARVTEEAKELSETVKQLEQMNRQLRTEYSKALHTRQMDETQPTMMLRHRVELLIAHNKRLREKVDELLKNDKKRGSRLKTVEPLYFHWTSAFKSEILTLKRRREGRPIDTLSEMESEPESIFVRAKKRRALKYKERKRRHDRISRIIGSSSSSEWLAPVRTSKEKAEDSGPTKCPKHPVRKNSQDNAIEKIKEQHRKEIAALKHSASKALADALNDQQRQITQSFEKERRQFQIKLTTERNALERKFTEEKMRMIDRLQGEFECELSRLRTIMSPSTSDDLRLFVRECGRCNNDDISGSESMKINRAQHAIHSSKFRILLEKFRRSGHTCGLFHPNDGNEILNIEKPPPSFVTLKPFCRMSQNKCPHYEMIRTKLKQIYAAVAGDGNIHESGFEDVISSADSVAEEKAHLNSEIKRLSSRLRLACEKIIELRAYLVSQNFHLGVPKCSSGCLESDCWQLGRSASVCVTSGNEWPGRRVFRDNISSSRMEQLSAENVLLNARLMEFAELVKLLIHEYNSQLDKTSRLGKFIRSIYSIDEEQL